MDTERTRMRGADYPHAGARRASRWRGGLVVLLLLLLAAPACTTAPDSSQRERTVTESHLQSNMWVDAQRGAQPANYQNSDVIVRPQRDSRIRRNEHNLLQVSTEPPADVPELRVAPEGKEGFYAATVDYLEQLPYGLMLYRDHDQLKWLVIVDPLSADGWEIRGSGTVREREGGLEFAERRGEAEEVVGIEQFPAQYARNRWTIRQAGQSQGRTVFGDLMRELGPEVHWVRVTVLDRQMEPMYTAPLIGRFNPITQPSAMADFLEPDPNRRLAIWPDGQWRIAVDSGDPEDAPTIYGGTWALEGEGRVTFTQTLPPEFALNPPAETFAFVFHPEYKVLWLTKIESAGGDQQTALQPALPGDTTVYQLYRAQRW